MEGYEPGKECSICQGRCCREKGCSLAPEDMIRELKRRNPSEVPEKMNQEDMQTRILEMLKDEKEGLYAIDHFTTENGPFFYLRMKHKCYTFVGIDPIGECVALDERGCRLPMERRPKGGRFLKSNERRQCVQHYTKEMMCRDWNPYQKILAAIFKEYEDKFRKDGTFDRCDDDYFKWLRSQREKMQNQKA